MLHHYLVLGGITLVILFLLFKIIKRTREWSFAAGIFFLYYWSVLGSWFLVYDEYTGKGKEIGLAYHYLFKKLFEVHADSLYMKTYCLYGLFIVLIEIFILWYATPFETTRQKPFKKKVIIHHPTLIFLSIGCILLSITLVWNRILVAAWNNESIYYVTRIYPDKFNTIHQVLNQLSVIALLLGLVVYLTGDKGKFMVGKTSGWTVFGYVLAVILVEGGLLILGNKREIVFGAIFAGIFYLNAVEYKINWKQLALFGFITAIPLVFNDPLRKLTPRFLVDVVTISNEVKEFEIEPSATYKGDISAGQISSGLLLNNEMFAGHFALYGIMKYNVPLTHGSSLKSLAVSFVPRSVYPDRPAPIYEYYVQKLSKDHKQGFTINHAAGWYLNFGILGIIAGALLFGFVWVSLYNLFHSIKDTTPEAFKILYIIGMGAFVAFVPTIIRTGPEGYKALIFEALIFPCLVIFIATLPVKIFNKN